MSTEYNALNPLFSSIRAEDSPAHCRITMWVKGQNIGTVCVGMDQRAEFLNLLFTTEDVAHRANGNVTTKFPMNENYQLLSEYGDVTTYGEIAGITHKS